MYDYSLMMKDIEVLQFDIKTGNVAVINEGLLPFGVRDTFGGLAGSFRDWLTERSIPLDRSNAKRLLNAMQLPQGGRLFTVITAKALSLKDCYWLRNNNSDDTWSSVSLYRNSYTEALQEIALVGRTRLTIQGKIHTPEYTTNGTYAKCWHRDNGKIYLYKTEYDSFECEAEYVSSIIADILKVNHVHYDLAKLYGKHCCRCENICNEDLSIMDISEYYSYRDQYQAMSLMDTYYFLPEGSREDFLSMLLLDGLIANVDRHLGNWGFTYNPNTHEILGLHPLFDHNCAIDIRDKEYFTTIPHSSITGITYLEAAKFAYFKMKGKKETELEELWKFYTSPKTRKLFKSLYRRLDELEYLKYLYKLVIQENTNIKGF